MTDRPSRLASVVRRLAMTALIAGAAWLPGAAFQDTQQPVFRTGTGIIELDVSVLGRDRRAVTGLTAADFTVFEDGVPQQVAAVSFVDVAQRDPARSARMRFVASDVATNDLGDELGSGRLVAIVLDDVNVPADDPDIVRSARETARYVIDGLGPSDMAAVVHARHGGRTQDFTTDRGKLFESVDAFVPVTPDLDQSAPGRPESAGDMVQRWSPALMRSPCLRNEPAVPALDAVTTRMATAPGRRKALIFLSVGVPVTLGGGSGCGSQINDVMRGVFRKAQVANINVYAIDPAGLNGYQEYLRLRPQVRQRAGPIGVRPRATNMRQLQDFMRVLAETTGGRAVINTNAIESAVDAIFEEDRSYYLVGYEPSNGAPDGRFRKVDVRVSRPNTIVRTRSGYYAPKADEIVRADASGARALAMAGLVGGTGLPLRASVVPVGPSATESPGGRAMDVAAVLTVRWPRRAPGGPAKDVLTIIRHVYDALGNAGPPVRTIVEVPLASAGVDPFRHDVHQHLDLDPGRYQVRFNVTSELVQASSSVYADLEVPDRVRAPLSIAGVALSLGSPGAESDPGSAARTLISRREFAAGEEVAGALVVFQGGTGALQPVTLTAEVVDATDAVRHASTRTIDPAAFSVNRAATHVAAVKLTDLAPGPYLFSIAARLPSGYTARKDVLVHVR